MARTSSAVVKPLVSRGYGKIVGLTLLAVVIGCALMAAELFGEYGGQFSAPRAAAVKIGSLPPAEKGAPAPAPAPGPGPVVPPPGPGGR